MRRHAGRRMMAAGGAIWALVGLWGAIAWSHPKPHRAVALVARPSVGAEPAAEPQRPRLPSRRTDTVRAAAAPVFRVAPPPVRRAPVFRVAPPPVRRAPVVRILPPQTVPQTSTQTS